MTMNAAVVLLLVVLAGCVPAGEQITHAAHEQTTDTALLNVHTVPEDILPGEETIIHVQLADADETPVALEVLHERLAHVLLIRDDVQHFAHIHPEDFGPVDANSGTFILKHVFPEPGSYQMMIEYAHHGELFVQQADFIVKGASKPVPIRADFSRSRENGEYTVAFTGPEKIQANKPAVLSFTVSKEGEPVEDLEFSLGELMHFVLWQEGMKYFEHAHPFGTSTTSFQLLLPSPATYKAFLQFQHQGKVITTEFFVKVE